MSQRIALRTGGSSEADLIPARALSRRGFLGSLSTALGAAALEGCNSAPPEKIIPYVDRPPEVVPGVGQLYATSTTRSGYGMGLLVESHTGRPTKIEGHPKHPASLGSTLVQEQAEVLGLYDPDRAKVLKERGNARAWKAFAERFGAAPAGAALQPASALEAPQLMLLEPTSSPLIESLLERLQARRPNTRVHFDPTTAPTSRWKAAAQLYARVVEPHYAFEAAEIVLALDADFLMAMPMSIRWSRDFAKLRDIAAPDGNLNRLYAVQSAMTLTAANADHYLPIRSSEIGHIAAGLLHALAEREPTLSFEAARADARRVWSSLTEHEQKWLRALGKDLSEHRGRGIVIVGEQQPAHVHVLGMALNELLGNVGKTVAYAASPIVGAGTAAYSLEPFLAALDSDEVAAAFVLGGNPAYALPPALRFEERLQKAHERIYLSLYENETARLCSWFIGAAHFLESWGDARGYDGTLSLRQPLIRPLYAGRSLEEVLATLAGLPLVEGRALLRQHFLENYGTEEAFETALRAGLLPDSGYAPVTLRPRLDAVADALRSMPPAHKGPALELDILPDSRVDDGRLANNRWLLELPEPITKLVWDNAALMAPQTASELGLARGDVIEITKAGTAILAPVLPVPGQARGTVAIRLGWGRQGAESAARGVGVNVVPLREPDNPWVTPGIEVRATGQRHRLVTTQDEFSMHGRELVLRKTQQEWQKHPSFAQRLDETPVTVLPERSLEPPQWGMTVDLNRCTGCSTCAVACQAENNVPSVGKEMVAMGREMHWLRIDSYLEGAKDHPKVLLQPMLCQHCEKAPCEYVCPVNATVHSDDGLNEMVYNRCVGTRFCSNNCPYKVRRFNFFEYHPQPPDVRQMVFNPDVTVRARGVMEKCTYCVQRIRRAQIDAKLEGHPLREGAVQTACQQACPTHAIVFGQVSDPDSRVSRHYRNLRTYAVLNELGTQPRTRYLARIDNPNEEIPE